MSKWTRSSGPVRVLKIFAVEINSGAKSIPATSYETRRPTDPTSNIENVVIRHKGHLPDSMNGRRATADTELIDRGKLFGVSGFKFSRRFFPAPKKFASTGPDPRNDQRWSVQF